MPSARWQRIMARVSRRHSGQRSREPEADRDRHQLAHDTCFLRSYSQSTRAAPAGFSAAACQAAPPAGQSRDGIASGPLLRHLVQDAQLHPGGGGLQRHAARAHPCHSEAGTRARRLAIRARAEPDATDGARPLDAAAAGTDACRSGCGQGACGADPQDRRRSASHRPAADHTTCRLRSTPSII
jgi:hypothetical protein